MTNLSTPYSGSIGSSGTDTSKARATYLQNSGIAGKIQDRIVQELDAAGKNGLTVNEVKNLAGLTDHHGSISGSLSVLHKDEKIARLTQKRGGCVIYVGLNHIDNRQTQKQGHPKTCPSCGHTWS